MSTFNGGWFYDELKEAIHHLGLRWGDMHLITIEVNGNDIKFSGNGRSITIQVCPDAQA
ncbi:hypothetical protein D3C76_469090 [compost metagenome]